jgi:lysozyme
MPGKMTDKGRHLLAVWEGFELKVYLDVAGLPTIGVGHLLTKDERSSGKIMIGGVPVKYEGGISDAQVNALLAQDLIEFEDVVGKAVAVELTPNQFDALVSFCFNIGKTSFRDSTLLRRLNQGEYDEVPDQLRRWTFSGGRRVAGLVARRENECKLWSNPVQG